MSDLKPSFTFSIVPPEQVKWGQEVEVIGDLARIKLLETRNDGEYFKPRMVLWLMDIEDKTLYGPMGLAQAKQTMSEFPQEFVLARELRDESKLGTKGVKPKP